MSQVANSWWMYLLGIIVVLFILAGCVFYIFKSYKDAKRINMDTKVLNKTIFNSVVFTVLPSISILIGVIALSGIVGVPLPWIRLTVIGALHYEVTAIGAAGYGSVTLAGIEAQQLVTIAFIMTLGVLSGPLFCLFGLKFYEKKALSKINKQNEVEEAKEEVSEETTDDVSPEVVEDLTPAKPKRGLGDMIFDAVFIAIVSSFIADKTFVPYYSEEEISKYPYLVGKEWIPFIVIIVSFACMFLFDVLEKKCKQKWLSSFSLGLSMIIGMAVAVLLGAVTKAELIMVFVLGAIVAVLAALLGGKNNEKK